MPYAPQRRGSLRRLIAENDLVRILEAHNGLTGRIVEEASGERDGQSLCFDGMWLSSLTDSTAKGKPDTGCVDPSSRLQTINEIFEVTTKPMIVDGDNGGLPENFAFFVKSLERLGVSAVIIEDKCGAKRNSLFGTDVAQTQDSIEDFSRKIRVGRAARVTEEFMVVARIESLILGHGLEDTLARAEAYIEAGADGIMIHSKNSDPAEVRAAWEGYQRLPKRVPLISVPTAYGSVDEVELVRRGVSIVIYANHLLRAAYPPMIRAAVALLEGGRCDVVDDLCMPIREILTLVEPPPTGEG